MSDSFDKTTKVMEAASRLDLTKILAIGLLALLGLYMYFEFQSERRENERFLDTVEKSNELREAELEALDRLAKALERGQ